MLEIDKASLPQRFVIAREFWKKAVSQGRARRTEFYEEAFGSPESELYEEFATDEIIFLTAKGMSEALVKHENLPAVTEKV